MTSIIGIKTNVGIESIIVGSDTQEVVYERDGENPSAKREEISKIITGSNWIISYAGNNNTDGFYRFTRFLKGDKRYLKEGETPDLLIKSAVENYVRYGKKFQGPHFRRVADSNADVMKEKNDTDELNIYLLAVYFDTRLNGLWYIDELGNLVEPKDQRELNKTEKDFDYICMGSGGEDMEKYIEQSVFEGEINTREIDIKEAVKMVFASLRKANKDPLTGFLKDIAIINKNGVERYGDIIKNKLIKAEREAEEEITSRYINS